MRTVNTILLAIALMLGSAAFGRPSEGSADFSSVQEDLESGVANPINVPRVGLTDDRKVVNEFLESVFGKEQPKAGSTANSRKAEAAHTAN